MNLQRPRAEEVEPTPRSSHRGKWDQIAIRPGGDFLMLRFFSTERDGLLYSSKCLACHDVSSMISRGGGTKSCKINRLETPETTFLRLPGSL